MKKLTFKQFLQEAPSIFRYVYHMTFASNIPQIRAKGLIRTSQATGTGWTVDKLKYKQPSIFVFTRKSDEVVDDVISLMVQKTQPTPDATSEDWDDNDWDKFLSSLRLLTIDLRKCSNVNLEPDPNAATWSHWKIMLGDVPPEAIANIETPKFSVLE